MGKVYFLFLIVVLGLDQLSKWLVREYIPNELFGNPDPITLIDGWLYFTHWHNTGGAFGIFQGQSQWLAAIAVLVFVAIVAMLLFFPRPSRMVNIGLSLIAGGAMGNLIDRLMLGHVVDFVQVCFNTTCVFPVFNIADSVIIIGTGLILFAWLTQKPPEPEPQPESEISALEE